MFVDEFERIWQILRGQGTVYDSQHINVTLYNGRKIQDALLYNKNEYKDDTGTVTAREAVFLVNGDMHVVPFEDIAEMSIL